jgi:DNA invertase Pin-like site-specific DNA recombinase
MTKFEEKGLCFKSLTENIDTSTATGKLVFQISGAFAEFERNIIRQRTSVGLSAARARGRLGGRPTKITPEKIRMAKQLHKDKNNEIKNILKALGVSRRVFYKMVKMGGSNNYETIK